MKTESLSKRHSGDAPGWFEDALLALTEIGPFVNLLGDTVRINDRTPKFVNAGRPVGTMTRAGIAPVDQLEASIDLIPIPGFYGSEEKFHGVGHFDSVPSRQSVSEFASRPTELNKLSGDDFLGSGHGRGIRFAPGKTAARPVARTRGNG